MYVFQKIHGFVIIWILCVVNYLKNTQGLCECTLHCWCCLTGTKKQEKRTECYMIGEGEIAQIVRMLDSSHHRQDNTWVHFLNASPMGKMNMDQIFTGHVHGVIISLIPLVLKENIKWNDFPPKHGVTCLWDNYYMYILIIMCNHTLQILKTKIWKTIQQYFYFP